MNSMSLSFSLWLHHQNSSCCVKAVFLHLAASKVNLDVSSQLLINNGLFYKLLEISA